jgi:hypothetical protein
VSTKAKSTKRFPHRTKPVNFCGHSKRWLALRLDAAERILAMSLPLDD